MRYLFAGLLLVVVIFGSLAAFLYSHPRDSVYRRSHRPSPARRYCRIYDKHTDLQSRGFNCSRTNSTPPAVICLYPSEQDLWVSRLIRHDGAYDSAAVRVLLRQLAALDNPVFIDAGANIGCFTNVISQRYRVIAVEPNIANVERLHHGLALSGTRGNVTIIHNGLSDRRNWVKVVRHPTNQGMTYLDRNCRACSAGIHTITMDDLLEVIPKSVKNVVIKMDIQGAEIKALSGAKRLFSEKNVRFLAVEWDIVTTFYKARRTRMEVNRVLDFLYASGLRPYGLRSESWKQLHRNDWPRWPHDIAWQRPQTNLS